MAKGKVGQTSNVESGAATPGLSLPAMQRLLAWLSPSFPVGGFSYSHGLEWAIEDGTVKTAADLEAWITDVLAHGAGRTDAVLFVHAFRAAESGDAPGLVAIAELAAAFHPSRERHLETTAQGAAFLTTVLATWPNERLAALAREFAREARCTYAVAVAIAAAAHGVPMVPAVAAFVNAFAANLVSAGVRAIPIGQTDGQRIIAGIGPMIAAIAEAALSRNLDELGGAVLRADIASMKHETQYTRLFRS